ncbi:hypothetical protein JCM6882_008854 [Rhodosporidiobolus microsporus]
MLALLPTVAVALTAMSPFPPFVLASPLLPRAAPTVVQNYTTTAGSTYAYRACYSDLAYGTRALPLGVATSARTVEACLEACAKCGYKLCGVEYHGECWGGNALDKTSTKQPESACNLECWDNPSQVCGGTGGSTNAAMNLYALDESSAPPPSSAPSPGPAVLQNHTTPSGPSYTYSSCVSDLAYGNRALPVLFTTTSDAGAKKTAEACLDACGKKGFGLCGVEYHGECWGGNTLHSTSTKQPESACDFTCWDNPKQICGGSGGPTGAAMTLYTVDEASLALAPTTGPLPLSNHTSSTGSFYTYDACYSDLAYGNRALGAALATERKTAEACIEACAARGFTLCGVEYHGECWGGNSLHETSTKQRESACDLTCWDNPNQVCGGQGGSTNAAMNLYKLTTADPCPTGFIVNGSCKSSCGPGYFQDNAARTCTACTVEGASECASAADVASACSSGFLKEGQCVESCGNGFFQDAEAKVCSACTVDGAATCTTAADVASTCSSGFLKDGACPSSCGDGFFQDAEAKTCAACTVDGAATCTTSADVATSCSSGFLKDGACPSSCGDGFFEDSEAKSCTACTAEGAATCSSAPDVASSCSSGFLKGGQCVEACGDGFFQDAEAKTCSACTVGGAATCTTAADVASSCSSGFLKDGACPSSCGDGFFQDVEAKTCAACTVEGAETCTSSPDVATSCSTGYLLSGACPSTCPTQGFYTDATTRQCSPCKSDRVATCTATAALTCKDWRVAGYTYEDDCWVKCPDGSYPQPGPGPYGGPVCTTCASRYGPSAATCDFIQPQSCTAGYFFKRGPMSTCETAESCAAGSNKQYFADPTTGICQFCSIANNGWSTCDANGPLTCMPPYILAPSTIKRCTLPCPSATYSYPVDPPSEPPTLYQQAQYFTADGNGCRNCLDRFARTCDPLTGKTTECTKNPSFCSNWA